VAMTYLVVAMTSLWPWTSCGHCCRVCQTVAV